MRVEDCIDCKCILTMKREKEGIGHHPVRRYYCELALTRTGEPKRIDSMRKCPKEEAEG